MPFSTSSLFVLARGGNFTLWRYETADAAENLLDAQYFSPAAGLFRRGDLVFCATTRAGSAHTGALLVVAAGDGRVLLEPLQAPVAAPLSSLQGVEVSGAAPGDVLTFSDGTWTNRPAAGHAGDVHAALHGNPHATTADEVGAIAASERGRPGGIATLDGDGLLSAAQLGQVALAEPSVRYWSFEFSRDSSGNRVKLKSESSRTPSVGDFPPTFRPTELVSPKAAICSSSEARNPMLSS